jgi:hypothetical protein
MNATAYIVAQTRENILFLQSTNQISSEDAQLILSKLPCDRYEAAKVATSPVMPTLNAEPPKKQALLSRPPPPIPSSFLFRVRALWNYNEDERVAESDLISIVSFLISVSTIGIK